MGTVFRFTSFDLQTNAPSRGGVTPGAFVRSLRHPHGMSVHWFRRALVNRLNALNVFNIRPELILSRWTR